MILIDKLHIEFINAMDNEYFQAMYEQFTIRTVVCVSFPE